MTNRWEQIWISDKGSVTGVLFRKPWKTFCHHNYMNYPPHFSLRSQVLITFEVFTCTKFSLKNLKVHFVGKLSDKMKTEEFLNRPYRTQMRLRVHMVKCLDKDSILVYSDDLSFWTMLHNSCSIQSNKFSRICSPDCFFLYLLLAFTDPNLHKRDRFMQSIRNRLK